MFGFGANRRRYNGQVDIKLNNEYQVVTRNNAYFPGMLAYLDLLDIAWRAKMSVDDAALYVATLYYGDLLGYEQFDLAETLRGRIESIVSFGMPKGIISQAHWSRFAAAMSELDIKYGLVDEF